MPATVGDLVIASVELPDRPERGIRILRADPCTRVAGKLLDEGVAAGVITHEKQTLRIEDIDGRTVTYRLSDYDATQDWWTAHLVEDTAATAT